MRVGHGAARLELMVAEPMGGYAERSRGVRGTLDPLEVHVVTFADEDRRFALVVADLICVNRDVVEQVRAAVRRLGVDTCWVSATHTHASPEAGCVPGGTVTPPDLAARLVSSALAATRLAVGAERESGLSATRVGVSGLGGRRNIAGEPLEIPVDAVVVTREDAVIGLIVVSPVHPTVLPGDNYHVSADLSGGIRRALRDDGRWVVVATGAAGDISTRHTRRGRQLHEVDRLGELVTDALAIDTSRISPQKGSGLVAPAVRCVQLAPKSPGEFDGMQVTPDGTRGGDGLPDARSRVVLDQGRQIAATLAAQARTEPYPTEIEAVGLDEVTLVAVPAELFLELGELIRAGARPGTTVIVLGYTNGYLGYLTDGDLSPTYEALVSPVRPDSGELVTQAALELVASITHKEQE